MSKVRLLMSYNEQLAGNNIIIAIITTIIWAGHVSSSLFGRDALSPPNAIIICEGRADESDECEEDKMDAI